MSSPWPSRGTRAYGASSTRPATTCWATRQMLVCPVRHHSPAAALQVERLIHERRPRAVLVEGPADANDLIPLLLDAETAPPVALYAYRQQAAPEGDGSGGDGRPARPPVGLADGRRVGEGTRERVRAVYYPFCDY